MFRPTCTLTVYIFLFLRAVSAAYGQAYKPQALDIDIEKKQAVTYANLIASERHVVYEMPEGLVMDRIDKTIIDDRHVLFYNENGVILLFSREGEFLYQIKTKDYPADSPPAISDVEFDEKTGMIQLMDPVNSVIWQVSTDNLLFNKQVFGPQLLSGIRFKALGAGYVFDRMTYGLDGNHLAWFDENFQFKKSAIPQRPLTANIPPAIGRQSMDCPGDRVYYLPELIDTIYQVGNDLAVEPAYVLRINQKVPYSERYKSHRLKNVAEYDAAFPTDRYARNFTKLLVTDKVVFLELSGTPLTYPDIP